MFDGLGREPDVWKVHVSLKNFFILFSLFLSFFICLFVCRVLSLHCPLLLLLLLLVLLCLVLPPDPSAPPTPLSLFLSLSLSLSLSFSPCLPPPTSSLQLSLYDFLFQMAPEGVDTRQQHITTAHGWRHCRRQQDPSWKMLSVWRPSVQRTSKRKGAAGRQSCTSSPSTNGTSRVTCSVSVCISACVSSSLSIEDVSVLVSAQDGILTWNKALMRSPSPLRSIPKIALNTVSV